MDCTTVEEEEALFMSVTKLWLVFICIIFGIIVGVCVAIIVVVCWVKVIKKEGCKRFHCFCCAALCAMSKKRMRKSLSTESGVMLAAWKEEDSESDDASGTEGDAITVFIDDGESKEKILKHSDSIMVRSGGDTESAAGDRFTVPLMEEPMRFKLTSLAEILSEQDWETRNNMMFENEKISILKVEEDFIRQKSDHFLFMLDCVTTQLVTSKQASEDWKRPLKDYCENELNRVKKMTQSHSIANLDSLQAQLPDTFQVNANGVIVALFEHIQKSIEEETDVEEMEVDVIVNEFQQNWSLFQRIHSDIYLELVKRLSHHFSQKVELVEVIETENNELMNEMVHHVDKHTSALKRLQIKDPFIELLSPEDRLAAEVEEIWQSTLDQFKMDLQRQKIQLSMEIREELDAEKRRCSTNQENEIQAVQEAIMREGGDMEDYIDKYCQVIQSKLNEHIRLECLETELTSKGFSSLTEAVGNRYLKVALTNESGIYARYLERTNWVQPNVSKVITQHQNNINNLQLKMKELRKMQQNRLRSQLDKKHEVLRSKCVDEIDNYHKSIKEVIELQADLSETERQQLLDQCIAQQKSFETQLELNRVKQERRLEQRLRQEKSKLSRSLEQVNNSRANPEIKFNATYQHQQKVKVLMESHQKSMEDLKEKMQKEIEAAKKAQELLFQQKIEHLRRGQERRLLLASRQQKAIKSLKNKLLNRLSNEAEHTVGERIIKEHQITKDVLKETIKKNKSYQQQVLMQKLQAKRLDKKQEKENYFKKDTQVLPYRPGSAKRFAANTLVSLLFEVRHKKAAKEMEKHLTSEGKRVKTQIERKFKIHSKLELQLREAEMIAKLATALGMTRGELEMEIKNSVQEQGHTPDSEYGVLLSKSVMELFDGCTSNK